MSHPTQELIDNFKQRFNSDRDNDIDTTYRNGQGKTKQLVIVPPKEYHWVESPETITPKASLTLSLFTEEVCQQLQEYQFNYAKLIGQKFNDFKDEDFSSRRWKEKNLDLTVVALDRPDDYRHGLPIVQLKGKNLAMFASDSPSLPIGSSFSATIDTTQNGSALVLNVDPDSVRVPLPVIDRHEINKPKKFHLNFSSDEPQISTSKNRFKINNNIANNSSMTQNSERENELEREASLALHQAIKKEYQNTGFSKIAIGNNWTALIRNDSCRIRDRDNRIILQSNLNSDRINQPLSEEDARIFLEMASDWTPSSAKGDREQMSDKNSNKDRDKSEPELS